MKKVLSLFLALILCLALLPSTASAANELPTPTDLVWGVNRRTLTNHGIKYSDSKTIPGYISWHSDSKEGGEFLVRIYSTDDPTSPVAEEKPYISWSGFYSSDLFVLGDQKTGSMESGTYYFTVQMLGDGKNTADSAVATSPTWTYIKPGKKLNPPDAPVWEYPAVRWNASEDNREFQSEIYFSSDGATLKRISWTASAEESINSRAWQDVGNFGAGNYYVRARAISQDITQFLNSDWSAYSAPYVWESGEKRPFDPFNPGFFGPYHDRYLDALKHLDKSFNERMDLNEQMRKAWSEADPSKYTMIQSRRIIAQSNEICAGLSSDYEKARAIYNWMTENITYDHDHYDGNKVSTAITPEEVLESRLTVCDGYARLTQALLQAQSIPAAYVSGYANGSHGWDNHAWNLAYVDGRWMYIDSTWERFDPTPEILAQDHVADSSSYDPYAVWWEYTPYPATSTAATPNRSTVLVNKQSVAFDAYTINQNNYFKLRDLAKVLNGTGKQFEVTWDGANSAINMVSRKPYTTVGGELTQGDGTDKTASLNTAIIYLDGSPVQLTAYTINQNNYFKLRDVGQTFDFDVTWDGTRNTIIIDTTRSYSPD